MTRGEITNLLMNVPPGFAKSIVTDVFWPAWEWGPMEMPATRYVTFSYSPSLTERDNGRFAKVIQSPLYRELYGDVVTFYPYALGATKVTNRETGWKIASSVGGVGTGERGDRIICFPYDEVIATKSGPRKIGELVERREQAMVRSFNRDCGTFELKPIVGWHKNPGRSLVEVKTDDDATFQCTADHMILTARGYWSAAGLRDDDFLFSAPSRMFVPSAGVAASPQWQVQMRPDIAGHHVMRNTDDRKPMLRRVKSVEFLHGESPKSTYCISVADNRNMMVGRSTSIVASNCDDPHNVKDAESEAVRSETVRWFRESITSRLNNPDRSATVIIMQRVHEDDVSGVVLGEYTGYVHLCYDAQTEVLARSGWVKFKELARGEAVLGVDPVSMKSRWEVPTRYVDYAYKGDMIAFKSKTADLLVTPDHRMVYFDHNDAGDTWASGRVKAAVGMPGSFELPQAVQWDTPREPIEFAGAVWDPAVFAEFMGWYLAEGCSNAARCRTVIVQNDGPLADEIDALLARIPFPKVRRGRHGRDGLSAWGIGSKALAVALEPLGKSRNKVVPDIVKSLCAEDLRRFIVAFAKGDGGAAGRDGNGIQMSSRSRTLIDGIQECAVKAGWASTMHERQSSAREFNGYIMPMGPMWTLYLRHSRRVGKHPKWYAGIREHHQSRIPYDGRVYCVSVPSTAIVVRRNGRVAVSGNCIPMEYDPDRHCRTWTNDQDPEIDEPFWEDWRTEEGELAFSERFPDWVVERDKIRMGPNATASQFQQSPTPRGGNIIDRAWWQIWPAPGYEPKPGQQLEFPPTSLRLGSVDTAYGQKDGNSYNAMTTWGVWLDQRERPKAMLMEAWRGRWPLRGIIPETAKTEDERKPYWGLVERVLNTIRKRQLDVVLIENKTRGGDLADELRALLREGECLVVMIEPTADKVARLNAVQALFADKMVFAPDRIWADMVITEVSQVPKGKYMDLADTVSQALTWMRQQGALQMGVEADSDNVRRGAFQSRRDPMYDV